MGGCSVILKEKTMLQPLSIHQLSRTIPSLYTTEGHGRTSQRYQPISTAMIVEKLISEGFLPTHAAQTNSRKQDAKLFSKHLIRFRHQDFNYTNSDIAPEIVLINSHDGLSSYRLFTGLVRFACLNGMISGTSYGDVKVRHQGDILNNVIEGSYEIVNNFGKMLHSVEHMKSIQVTDEKKHELATKAHALRFDSDAPSVFEPGKLLRPRRNADTNNDLFTVFNVLQENIIRGGINGYRRNERGYWRPTRSREVKSIDQTIRLNRELWSTTEKLIPQIS